MNANITAPTIFEVASSQTFQTVSSRSSISENHPSTHLNEKVGLAYRLLLSQACGPAPPRCRRASPRRCLQQSGSRAARAPRRRSRRDDHRTGAAPRMRGTNNRTRRVRSGTRERESPIQAWGSPAEGGWVVGPTWATALNALPFGGLH